MASLFSISNNNLVVRKRVKKLAAGSGLATLMAAGLFLTPVSMGPALAANECGALGGAEANATRTCTGTFVNGIEYSPAAVNEVFTLNIGNGTGAGGAAAVVAPTAGILSTGQPGVLIGNFTNILGVIVPTTGVQATSVLNIDAFSNVSGTSAGVIVMTDGTGNDATANNHGTVLGLGTGGFGTLYNGIGITVVAGTLGGAAGGGNASATNFADGEVNARNNAINVWADTGTATALNEGSLHSDQRDGISTLDPLTGLIPTAGTGTGTNNGTIFAGRNGLNIVSVGDATVNLGETSVITAGQFTSGAGAYAVSLTGNAVIDADALSETTSATGPGLVGISLGGTSTVDAGVVNSGSDAISLFGFPLPPIPGVGSISGGVLSIAAGDATANAHGDINTTGTFGVLALSLTGNATAHSDAGIKIDPVIGMAAVTFSADPLDTAWVDNNAAVTATGVGLLALNLGAGNALVDNTAATVTAPISATAVSLFANATVNNQSGSTLNGAVVIAAGVDGVLNNTGASDINIAGVSGIAILAGNDAVIHNNQDSNISMTGPLNFNFMLAGQDAIINNTGDNDLSTPTFVMAGDVSANVMIAGRDALLYNTGGATFSLEGDILNANLMVAGTGNAVIWNNLDSTFTMQGLLNGNLMFAGNDAAIDNYNSSDFLIAGAVNGNVMVAGRDASIDNVNDSTFTMLGALNGNLMLAANNASIVNDQGSDFSMLGLVNGNFMAAGGDATIHNDRGSDFTMAGLASGNVMLAGNDATIINERGSDFTMLGLVNGNFMSAGSNATIDNNRGGEFTMAGLANGNFMGAGNDATIYNDRGGEFTMLGIANGNFMVAGNDASIINDRGGEFTMLDALGGNFMIAGRNATIANDNGGEFAMLGLVNGNFVVAANDATIDNDDGSSFLMAGLANGQLIAGGNNATINNTDGSDFTLLGLANGQLMVAGNDATINNLNGSEMTFANIIGAQALVAADWASINNYDSTMNFLGGINIVGFAGANGDAFNNEGLVYVDGVTTFLGLDNFNNYYGTLSMVDGEVDDETITTGNFNGYAGSELAIDAELTPGGVADHLHIGDPISGTGDLTGETFLYVNDIDGGPGQYDPYGVLFATVQGDSDPGNFTTGGGIDKGLFRYDAYLLPDDVTGDQNEWYLASTLDREAYEFPMMMGAAQSLWNYTTGTWLDRTADLRTALNGGGMPACAKDCPPTTGTVTPGFWMKAVGASTSRDFSKRSSPPVDMLGPTYTYKGGVDQDIYGFLGGVDFGNQGVSASGTNEAWLFGIMGGYVGSDLSYDKSSTDVDYSAGSIGAYATYLNGGWFVDAVIKADLGNMDYSSNLGGGFSDSTSSDFTSIGAVLDTGYRFDGGSGVFFEPKATLSYVSTDIDNMNVLGTRVKFDDGDSLMGRLGGRIGTSMDGAASITELYLEANAWNEFEGDYKASLLSNGFSVPVGYDTGGLYGEVAGGVNIFGTAEGWNGFAKAAVQFGEDDFIGYSGNLGFRYGF